MLNIKTELADSWISIHLEKMKQLFQENKHILKMGRPIIPDEYRYLTDPHQSEYAKIRRVLTIDQAKDQIIRYITTITPTRNAIFFSILAEGVLYSIDHGIGHFRGSHLEEHKHASLEEAIFYRRVMCAESKYVPYTFQGMGELLARCKMATPLEQILGRDLYISDRIHRQGQPSPRSKPSAIESTIIVKPLIGSVPGALAPRFTQCVNCGKSEDALPPGTHLGAQGLCPNCASAATLKTIQTALFAPTRQKILHACETLEDSWFHAIHS